MAAISLCLQLFRAKPGNINNTNVANKYIDNNNP